MGELDWRTFGPGVLVPLTVWARERGEDVSRGSSGAEVDIVGGLLVLLEEGEGEEAEERESLVLSFC